MSRHCIVIYPYQAQTDSELTINQDETLQIVKDDGDWWLVRNNSGREGYIPSNYVQMQAAAPAAAAAPSNTGYNGLDGLFGGTPQSSNNSNSQQPSSASAGPPKETCTAQHEYTAQRQDELSLSPGLKIEILSKSDDGWWMGRANGKDGWFPHNFVTADPVAVAAPAASSEILQPSNGLGGIDFSQGDSQKNNLKSDVLHVAKALYQFEGQAGELSLQPDLQVEIIEKTNADWWRARLPTTGETGLIPFNYVEVLRDNHPQPTQNGSYQPTSDISQKIYFKGPIGRSAAENLLRAASVGQFLVRTSESNPQADQYSISVRGNSRMRHFSTKYENGKWKIGQKSFDDFDALIEHYTRLPIFVDSTEKLNLTSPVR